MKKLIILMLFLSSCTQSVLDRKSFKTVDTLDVSKNGFGYILGYDVLIKYNSQYYFGHIDKQGELIRLSFKPIKICEE